MAHNLFWRGFIVGPNESEEAFHRRVASTTLEASIQVDRFNINWIPVIYSNRCLRIWEGGCSWIGEGTVTIQLRQKLARKKRLWGLYSKEEIFAHEAIHAMRVQFEEPVFEEMLAYRTSRSPFRRLFGPLFRAPWESLCAALLIAVLPFFPFLAPLVGLGGVFLLYRLRKARGVLLLTEAKLSRLSDGLGYPWLLGLTDQEIFLFSTLSLEEILHYCEQQACFRWKQLKKTLYVQKDVFLKS